MGCASSKQVDGAISVYRPSPTSFAVFDINSIEEPWFNKATTEAHLDNNEKVQQDEEPTKFPKPILDKLKTLELEPTPQSWEELSKTLEDLKKPEARSAPPKKLDASATSLPASDVSFKTAPRKSFSFHTLEELDAKLTPSEQKPRKELRKTESAITTDTKKQDTQLKPKLALSNTVKDNIFILRDKLEREKEGKQAAIDKIIAAKKDPLSMFPEKCPPGGQDKVVIYTTSLRGVRRTYDDCARAKSVLETHRVAFDERDVSLHAEFLAELKGLVGDEESVPVSVSVPVPRVFVKGRYVGGVEELSELNETGRLGRVFSRAGVERGVGRQACEGCGGARFLPCLDCGGSCKVLVGKDKLRCDKCNENGLVYCPLCL